MRERTREGKGEGMDGGKWRLSERASESDDDEEEVGDGPPGSPGMKGSRERGRRRETVAGKGEQLVGRTPRGSAVALLTHRVVAVLVLVVRIAHVALA